MQDIEPYFNWRQFYITEEDEHSPYFQKEYSEFEYVDTIYNHYIHPQWDSIESESLFVKILFADYEEGYAFIELIGEWNDAIHNDIELLKGNLLDTLIGAGISKIILIGDNVLNFHFDGDYYYEELIEDLEGGYIIGFNFMDHVVREFSDNNLSAYIKMDESFYIDTWRTFTPLALFNVIESTFSSRLA
jgi:hypothetical protein